MSQEEAGHGSESGREQVLGVGGAWAMAVGGMIGGGIFSTLGVVISVAGEWAWLSFLMGGVIALATGHSYSGLTRQIGKAGGSYAYLRALGRDRLARVVVWVLVLGYTLTVAVYAVTFGAYAAYALSAPAWIRDGAALAAIALLAGVNLAGAAKANTLEKVAVWGKLAILLGLAGIGLAHWAPDRLVLEANQPVGFAGALVGMGVVFMAYEGFQLLSYDYADMKDAKRTIARAMPAAIVTTAVTYIVVAIGAAMLAGASQIVAHKEVALAIAGREALGTFGFLAVSLAATFSAASAINATIFATARLALQAAEEGEMPAAFARRDSEGAPWAGTVLISAVAMGLTLIGGIEALVEGASFVFLGVFALVNWIAIERRIPHHWAAMVGLAGSGGGAVMLVLHLAGQV
ncbi:APC family permease [Tsuneonella sp. YG55]|uniref:APC family permease n=1 Tax=Tsuneonella litorea TaxID=2976475 RepID=A0A9X2W0G5_9SPHN|nr:APC family permease [Tsuneonella litorea]MCT2558845.1 APC family permease [Tsuneonella litorea]